MSRRLTDRSLTRNARPEGGERGGQDILVGTEYAVFFSFIFFISPHFSLLFGLMTCSVCSFRRLVGVSCFYSILWLG